MSTLMFLYLYWLADLGLESATLWRVLILLLVCDVISFAVGRSSKPDQDIAVKSRPWES